MMDDASTFLDRARDEGLLTEEARTRIEGWIRLGKAAETRIETLVTGGEVGRLAAAGGARFESRGILGQGGMGVVVEAFDRDLEREVAVKTLRDPEAIALVERFVEEARITGQLEHPHVVPVHELGVEPGTGRPYLVMKRVRGKSLLELLDSMRADRPGSRGRASRRVRRAHGESTDPGAARKLSRLLDVFLKICDGVAYAHSRGIVHRDLKPANIMTGEFGEVLVMDWGLAKARGKESGSGRVEIAGTPAYMSPEQSRGDASALDERSDVYSLGAILYEILSLERARSDGCAAHDEDEDIPAPSSRSKAPWPIPRELELVAMKALAREPRDRYADAATLRGEIEAHLAGRTLASVSYSPWEILAKWVKRNRALGGGIAAAILAILLGVAGMIATRARERALASAERIWLAEEAFEAGEVAWRLAEEEPWNDASPQSYFRLRVGALARMGEALQRHPDAPRDWRSEVAQRVIRLRKEAVSVSDWALAEILVESAAAWGAMDEGVREAQIASVEAARETAQGEDLDRLEEALRRVRSFQGEGERQGRIVPGELEERARRLARHAEGAAVRRAMDILIEADPGPLERVLLAEFLGHAGDAVTAHHGISVPDLVARALDQGAAGPDPARADERAAWVRAAARLDARRPGAIPDLEARWSSLSSAHQDIGPVAVAVSRARRLSEAMRGGRASSGPATAAGAERFLDTIEGLADRVAASVREVRSVSARIREELGEARDTRGPVERAFLCEVLGRLEAPGPARGSGANPAVSVLLATFESACARLSESTAADAYVSGLLDLAVSAALALSRLEAPDFALPLQERRHLWGPHSILWERTELAFALLPIGSEVPTSALGYRRRASMRADRGDPAGALADIERALELDPADLSTRAERARFLTAAGDPIRAIEEFDRVLELDDRVPSAVMDRGIAREAAGDLEGAIRDYSRAIELAPSYALAHNNRGVARARLRDSSGAVDDFTRALQIDPTFAKAYSNRGLSRAERGEHDLAIEDYTRAIALAPDLAGVYVNRGISRRSAGDLGGAAEDYSLAIELDAGCASAYTERGSLLGAQGQIEAAVGDCERAVLLDPDDANAWINLTYARTDVGDHGGALAAATRAIEIDPAGARGYNARGTVEDARGERARAVVDYARAVELDPGYVEAHYNRGLARADLGEFDGAIGDFDRALAIRPDYWSAWVARGMVLAHVGRAADAVESFEEALRVSPASARGEVEAARRRALGG